MTYALKRRQSSGAVFFALGVPGVIAGIMVWLTVREPRRGCLDSDEDSEAPSFTDTMRFLWLQRSGCT
jgi:hypothetical protein